MQAGVAVHGATPALAVSRNGARGTCARRPAPCAPTSWSWRPTATPTICGPGCDAASCRCTARSSPASRCRMRIMPTRLGAVRDRARHGVLPARPRQPPADGRPQPSARHQRTARAAIPDRLRAHGCGPRCEAHAGRMRGAANSAITPDHYPHVHEPDESVLVCLGYNGRGVAMSTAMGPQLARRVIGRRHRHADHHAKGDPVPRPVAIRGEGAGGVRTDPGFPGVVTCEGGGQTLT